MKKGLISVLLIVTIASCLIGCGTENSKTKKENVSGEMTGKESSSDCTEQNQTEETTVHTHFYKESITREATCAVVGEITFTCDCGDSYIQNINLKEHSYGEYIYDNNATNMIDGTMTARCKVCGHDDVKIAVGTKIPPVLEWSDYEIETYKEGHTILQPVHIYYKDGKVIVDCYVINNLPNSVYGIDGYMRVRSVRDDVTIFEGVYCDLKNKDGSCMEIEPYGIEECTLVFSGDDVQNYGADLSDIRWDGEGVGDPVGQVWDQLTTGMSKLVENFKAKSEEEQLKKTIRLKVGESTVINTTWSEYKLLSQDMFVAAVDGKTITGVGTDTTYIVMKASDGKMEVYRVIVTASE